MTSNISSSTFVQLILLQNGGSCTNETFLALDVDAGIMSDGSWRATSVMTEDAINTSVALSSFIFAKWMPLMLLSLLQSSRLRLILAGLLGYLHVQKERVCISPFKQRLCSVWF